MPLLKTVQVTPNAQTMEQNVHWLKRAGIWRVNSLKFLMFRVALAARSVESLLTSTGRLPGGCKVVIRVSLCRLWQSTAHSKHWRAPAVINRNRQGKDDSWALRNATVPGAFFLRRREAIKTKRHLQASSLCSGAGVLLLEGARSGALSLNFERRPRAMFWEECFSVGERWK